MKKVIVWAFTALLLGGLALTSCKKNDITKREQARYTIMVYGNAGGRMDHIIEDLWDQLKPMLTDSTDVRMVFLYKYGAESEDFSGRYGDPGDVLWFELNSETDLNKLKETSARQAPGFPLYEPYHLSSFIKITKQLCPADNYIFALWGHGGGFDVVNDRPNNIIIDNSRGVLYDELDEHKGMSMYELADALATAGDVHFPCFLFHNCLMGNIETLTEVQQYADYFFTSSHVLSSDGEPFVELLKVLQGNDDYDFENIAEKWFANLRPVFDQRMVNEGISQNLNVNVIRASEIANLNLYLKGLAERLEYLYPTKKAAIDSAAAFYVYRYKVAEPYLIDIDYYAKTLDHFAGDSLVSLYAQGIHDIFGRLFVQRWHFNAPTGGLDDYSLSIVFGHHDFLHTVIHDNTIASAYYPSVFNRRTGWANWINTNTFWPDVTMSPEGGMTLSWESYLQFLLLQN